MLEREWTDYERTIIRKSAALMKELRGRIVQRELARSLVRRIDRSEASIYGEIRRMMRSGGWWSHVPVSAQMGV